MKGFKEYVEKHGNHFTLPLAEVASKSLSEHPHWNTTNLHDILSRKVFYKINSASDGDMLYMANLAYTKLFDGVKNKEKPSIEYILTIVQNTEGYNGMAFATWAANLMVRDEDFDFAKYI